MEVRQGATNAQLQIAMLCGKASRIPRILPLCKTDADKTDMPMQHQTESMERE
jgi:hypothetical protein